MKFKLRLTKKGVLSCDFLLHIMSYLIFVNDANIHKKILIPKSSANFFCCVRGGRGEFFVSVRTF